jgi:uroporphyrinogen decarboxylase
MKPHERVIAAIDHRTPDRTPLDGGFRQDAWKKLEDHFGTSDEEIIMERLGLDLRYAMMEPSVSFAEQAIPSPWEIPDIGVGEKNLGIMRDNGWFEDEYGICRVPNATGLYWHYSHHPLAKAGLEEINKFAFPSLTQKERYAGILSNMTRWKNTYFTIVEVRNIFKLSWELRGFDRYMIDLATDPLLVETLADRALDHLIEQSKQLLKSGVDMLMITGDIAMQKSMILSPVMWRKYFKPRLKMWLEEIRLEHDCYFMFHSDGDMLDVMGDLIEIGFDAITPIQPECLDLEEIESRFGSQTCLHGTISCQQTLPFGTREDVIAEVNYRMSCLGKNGGLILAPSNTVQPDVPIENILALYETAKGLSFG